MSRTKINEAETLLAIHLTENEIDFEREVQLDPKRKWRWDFLVGCGRSPFAVEVQGGIWRKKGAHNTGVAITRDCQKMRAAIMADYTPVNFTVQEVLTGTAIKWFLQYFEKERTR
ncbi:hypothetical protein LCGC14_2574210 [marine sediment metagenome]|uniref:DUF559 domain-containing protein n=1 Tax=marine sediment metagenome TaxID=412755 RepID=A0A0F9AGD5_9ZZZZ